jgi:acyl-CoA thioesterase FadM
VNIGLFISWTGYSSVDYKVGIFDKKESAKASSVGGFNHVFVDRESNRPKAFDKLFRSKLAEILN